MENPDAAIDFAYRYPFSKEAREYVSQLGARFDPSMLEMGRARLEQSLSRARMEYSGASIREVKQKSILSYVYARMLVSALGSKLALDRFVKAEARRAGEALQEESEQNVLKIGRELGIDLKYDGEFAAQFDDFLKLAPKVPEYALVHQELANGMVYMQKYRAARVVEGAARREIAKGLPIPLKELPREAIAYSKTIKVPLPKISVRVDERRYEWIAKLLATPITDVRHRAVNLILAPYLVNVKNMEVEDAAKVIVVYIERCRQIDPNTRINESYIRYQCKYAKAKGSRPLSYEKAREMLKGVLSF